MSRPESQASYQALMALEAAPACGQAQLRAGLALINENRFQEALQILARPCEDQGRVVADKLSCQLVIHSLTRNLEGLAKGMALLSACGEPDQIAWALILEACRLAREGQEDVAEQLFHRAARLGVPSASYVAAVSEYWTETSMPLDWLEQRYPFVFPNAQSRLAIRSLTYKAYIQFSLPGARATQRDPLFGPVGEALSSNHYGLMSALLENRWQAYEAGALPTPELQDFLCSDRLAEGLKIKLLIASRSELKKTSSELPQPNEFHHHVVCSAAAVGMEVTVCDLNPLLPETDQSGLGQGGDWQAAFEQALEDSQPDLVVWEGEVPPARLGAGVAEALQTWRQTFDFRLAVFVPDTHDAHLNLIAAWIGLADVILCDDQETYYLSHFSKEKILPTIGNPLDPALLLDAERPAAERDVDLVFLGSEVRARSFMLSQLSEIADRAVTSRSLGTSAVSMQDYFKCYASAKLAFNSSHQGVRSIQNGRAVEAISSGAVLLQFDSPCIERFFVPYIHYVPVANLDQAVQFARFLWQEPGWRDRIATAAYQEYQQRFSYRNYWAKLLDRCGL